MSKSGVVRSYLKKILAGEDLFEEEIFSLVPITGERDLFELMDAAREITRTFCGGRASLCAIVNAKSGLCAEDCSFCAQSARFLAPIQRYPLIDPEAILEKARAAKDYGAHEFCVVTSGSKLNESEFEKLLVILQALGAEVSLQRDVSVGFLTPKQCKQLKRIGVGRVNHNVQTSPSFYPQIVHTHTYQERLMTLKAIRDSELELCSGVLWGLGESEQDRIQAALQLRKFRPECVPINLLDPRPGTPLAHMRPLFINEILKSIAIYRFVLPRTQLRLAGGRRVQLGPSQAEAFEAGINGLIIGDYLTTAGNSLEEDFENLKRAGFEYELNPKGDDLC